MWRQLALILLCVALLMTYIVSLGKITEQIKLIPKGEDTAYVMPSPILRLTTLEFHGLASDFLFLKALVFLGSTYERKEEPPVKEWEWKWLYHVLDASASLDPYFLDPYSFGNANLTWGGGLIRETNALLEKGSHYRSWDSLLPFYAGFNYFYFLDDNQKASEFLMEASRRQDEIPFYANLAVRLAYKERRTENAIAFQEYFLEHTEDPILHKEYETRLDALRGVLYLEKAVAEYKRKFGKDPQRIEELITKRFIDKLPREPYGGHYYIDSLGKVTTTSESKLMPYQHLRLNLLPSSPSLFLPEHSLF
jgi:hypothetical protein